MFDLALVTRGNETIGWGHAARMYALALEAEKRDLRTVLVTNTPEVVAWRPWPCEVTTGAVKAQRSIIDEGVGAADTFRVEDQYWTIHVNPHLASVPLSGGRWLCGARWMPLRQNAQRGTGLWPVGSGPHVMSYRWSGERPDAGRIRYVKPGEPCRAAVVPPSTIAYECMAAGIPVLLHDNARGHTPEMDAALKRIGRAMIDAGAAVKFTPEALEATLRGGPGGARSHTLVDGLGAKRLLDYIVGRA